MQRRFIVFIIAFFGFGCASRPPAVNYCDIISPDLAQCHNTKNKKYSDLDIVEMIGHRCVSPDDLSKIKKFIVEAFDEF